MTDQTASQIENLDVAPIAKAVKEVNTSVVGQIKKALTHAAGNGKKQILANVPVDLFIAVSSYENNRDVAERAVKQAKAGGAHQNGDTVAIVELDKERNKALWERTEKIAEANGIPHTLPFIKADGHTRAYGWSHYSALSGTRDGIYTQDQYNGTIKIGVWATGDDKGKDCFITKKDAYKSLFTRPESLFITVHKGLTDDQIFELVKEYCDGVSKANNKELQQMGMKKVEFSPNTDFVKKDSWKTAFRTISRDHGKNTDAAIEKFKGELQAIDDLNINTKSTTKKLSGVRAALILTHVSAEVGGKLEQWQEFWKEFYSNETESKEINKLIASLANLGTGDSGKACEKCETVFNKFSK